MRPMDPTGFREDSFVGARSRDHAEPYPIREHERAGSTLPRACRSLLDLVCAEDLVVEAFSSQRLVVALATEQADEACGIALVDTMEHDLVTPTERA